MARKLLLWGLASALLIQCLLTNVACSRKLGSVEDEKAYGSPTSGTPAKTPTPDPNVNPKPNPGKAYTTPPGGSGSGTGGSYGHAPSGGSGSGTGGSYGHAPSGGSGSGTGHTPSDGSGSGTGGSYGHGPSGGSGSGSSGPKGGAYGSTPGGSSSGSTTPPGGTGSGSKTPPSDGGSKLPPGGSSSGSKNPPGEPGSKTPGVPMPPATWFPSPLPPFLTGTCDYWRTHPQAIWAICGYWSTIGRMLGFSPPATSPSLTLLDALRNSRTDGMGELFREGTAAFLNSISNRNFVFSTSQVRNAFASAMVSDQAAAAQARIFQRANEGRL